MTHRIRLSRENEHPLILLEGEFTAEIHSELSSVYHSLNDESKSSRIIIDFSKVSYINSSGIAALIEIITANEKFGGVIECFHPQSHIEHILQVVGLDDFLEITGK